MKINPSLIQLPKLSSGFLNRMVLSILFTFSASAQTLNIPKLGSYLGIYSNKQIPLKITISKNDTTLIAQATGQVAIPLEARAKDQFLYYKAGIELHTNQSPEKFEEMANRLMLETSKAMEATAFTKLYLK
ncbi:hypothetical protein [Pedobacter gandavensis]|uniref:hypothetical protein n=1 Tax=Pedobacter gandavensis TaxID=2679963 RepID=UPI00292CB78F|nr:hypothetical protein [Pedobacter gandavensis]